MSETSKKFQQTSFNFDDYLKSTIGEFGRYQQFILILLCIPACFLSSWGGIDMVFIAYTPTHKCNETKSENVSMMNNYSLINKQPLECSINYTYWNGSSNWTIEDDQCQKWQYDHEYFETTIITQFNLVCNEALIPRTIIALLNLATLVAIVYSFLQDRIGRKKAFFVNLTVYLIGNCGSLLAKSPTIFAVLKFVGGISVLWEIGYCWTLEFAGPSHRTTVSTLMTILYSLATASIALVAYLSSTWVQVGFCTSVPFVFLYLYVFIVPESPRWLLSQGRTDEAFEIIKKMARWNGVKIDPVALRERMKTCEISKEDSAKRIGMMEFFKSSNLRWKNGFITTIGIIANQLYYAIPYSLENLQGNFLIAFVLQALVEAPAALLNLALINRFGRILPQSILLCLAGISCLLSWPLSYAGEYGAVAMAVAARFFTAGAVAINEQVECEMYPTVARGVGTSVSYVCYTLFGIGAQYLLYTSTVWDILPLLIMGTLSFLAGILCLFLPETKGKNLPDTIEEAEAQGSVGWESFKSHFTCSKKIRRFSNSVYNEKGNAIA